MSERTDHGDNIADQIQSEDAYGYSGDLTIADVWNILDNLHSQFMNQYVRSGGYPEPEKDLCNFFNRWMDELSDIDPDMETI